MKQEQLFKNLDTALDEPKKMLDTLEAVKGTAYASVVHKMMIAHQATDLVDVILKHFVRDECKLPASLMCRSIAEALGVIIADYAELAEIQPEQEAELIADCDRIIETTKGLLKSAHNAAVKGTGFGDDDDQ